MNSLANNDAKDLLLFIIRQLHQELNKKNNNTNLNLSSNKNIDQSNEKDVFNDFLEDFEKENQSIISELFYGVNHTITKCSECKIVKHYFQAYFFLIFPLEEVKKLKLIKLMENNNNIMLNQNQKNEKIKSLKESNIDIQDCFEYYYQKVDKLSGENGMYCLTCQKQLGTTYQTVLYTLPEILIIIFNKGKVKIKLSEYLNLNDYAKYGGKYELISVITHNGKSGPYGSFIAIFKNAVDHRWYSYINANITFINDFKNDILNYGTPYILFYKRE